MLPRITIPEVVPERPPTPYPRQRQFSQVIPLVESTSSVYSSPNTLVHDYQRTPEWQEYRNSIATSNTEVADRILTGERTNSTRSGTDSDNVETEPDRSSTAGIFYRRQQVPVDAVDTLEIIADNLNKLKKEELAREYHEAFDKAHQYLLQVIRILDTVPRETSNVIPSTWNFAQFLNHQFTYLRSRIISPTNLTDPDLYIDIDKLHSNLRARRLHQSFLRNTQRV